MLDWFGSLGGWSWVVLGLVLIGGEMLAPGVFLIWLGLAALLTGVVVGAFGIGWQAAALVFAALSLASVLAGRLADPAQERGARCRDRAERSRPAAHRQGRQTGRDDDRRRGAHPRRRFLLAHHRTRTARRQRSPHRARRRCDTGGREGLTPRGYPLEKRPSFRIGAAAPPGRDDGAFSKIMVVSHCNKSIADAPAANPIAP